MWGVWTRGVLVHCTQNCSKVRTNMQSMIQMMESSDFTLLSIIITKVSSANTNISICSMRTIASTLGSMHQ